MLSQKQKQLEIQEKIKNDNKISEETIKAAAQIKQAIQDQETSNQQSPEGKKDENKDQVGEILAKQDPKDVPDSDDDTVQGAVKGAATDAIDKRKKLGNGVIDRARLRLNEIGSQMEEQREAIELEQQILK